MKILFVCPNLTGGGVERVISILSSKFADSGYETAIVTVKGDEKTYEVSEKIHYLPIEVNHKMLLIRRFIRFLKTRKTIKSFNPDCVISFSVYMNIYSIACCMFTRYKLILCERNDPELYPYRKIDRFLRKVLYFLADGYVFQTDEAMKYFSRSIQKRGIVIPNPIKDHLPSSYEGIRKKEIVGVGRLDAQKNWMLLIKAFESFVIKHPDYKLTIYGEGYLRQPLEEYVSGSEQIKDKITFPGFVNDIHSRILDSAMYISSSDHEGISNSMLEALALGIPSICTDCPPGGARMHINNGVNGILIPVGDEIALYNAMERLVENPEFAKIISKNAIKIRETRSADLIFNMWKELIENKCEGALARAI